MASWQDLDRELQTWAAAGRAVTLWWRDDDAAQTRPELQRLLELAAEFAVPIHLATVPARMDADFADQLGRYHEVRVLQHGYAHTDHIATPGQGAAELGPERPLELVCAEATAGWRQLEARGFEKLLPVMVPPWNSISPGLVARLPGLGYRMLSHFGARGAREAVPGLLQVHCHCDPIKWKGGARFCGTAAALDAFVGHLIARRRGEADVSEPTGLVSHHLDTDAATWDFMENLLARTSGRPVLQWIGLESLLMTREKEAPRA